MPDFPILAALTRLGRKYQIDFLFDRSVAWLERIFPDTIDKWDSGFQEFVAERELHALAAAKLGHEVDIPQIMPATCFLLIRAPAEEIFDLDLSPSLLKRMVIAKDETRNLVATETWGYVVEGAYVSCANDNCQETRRNLCMHLGEITSAFDSYQALDDMECLDDGKIFLCPDCEKVYNEENEKGRSAVWEALPKLFGYTSWDSIRSEKRYVHRCRHFKGLLLMKVIPDVNRPSCWNCNLHSAGLKPTWTNPQLHNQKSPEIPP